ncbi:hypothetical protein Pecwa_3552 [Pectobacterium parmentieri WPP163]|nr:hypothetical protein Pecwa_3552 [Pectobacterium parmentieri WPP163]EJS92878.1 Hypothetical protein Y17_3704 [Pectobacterium wasabiae CFBP 3304]POW28762.1 hypothetical protein PB20LOC_01195 [Pectobacterium parmentieri]GKW25216.1 hypothetical protein PEC311524_28100 [Pectobacterium carotovorum subsp. carotovorum]
MPADWQISILIYPRDFRISALKADGYKRYFMSARIIDAIGTLMKSDRL